MSNKVMVDMKDLGSLNRDKGSAICEVVLYHLNVWQGKLLGELKAGRKGEIEEAVVSALTNLRSATVEELVRQFDGDK